MPGGKGKSIGGKGGSKDSAGKAQKSHSAKAGLQVSWWSICLDAYAGHHMENMRSRGLLADEARCSDASIGFPLTGYWASVVARGVA